MRLESKGIFHIAESTLNGIREKIFTMKSQIFKYYKCPLAQ